MAWTHHGNRGTAQNKTSSTTLSITLNANVGAGRILAFWLATDSFTSTPYPATVSLDNYVTKVTDSAGNIWAQIWGAGGYSTGDRVHAYLYLTRVKYALSAGQTVTVHFYQAVPAKAGTIEEFSSTKGGWARVPNQTHQVEWTTASGDVPNLTTPLSGLPLPSGESFLYLHTLAVEGPDTDTYTWDGTYTQITGTGTTGGAADSNVHIRGSFKITSSTTQQQINITSNTADRDLSTVLQLITEVAIAPQFPTKPIVDHFNRGNENPMVEGNWVKSESGGGLGGVSAMDVTSDFEITGNTVEVIRTGHDDDYGKYHWVKNPFPCGTGEVYITIAGVPSNSIVSLPIPQPPTNGGSRGVGVGFMSMVDDDFLAGPSTHFLRKGKFYIDDLLWAHTPGQGMRTFTGSVSPMTAGMRIGVQWVRGRQHHYWVDRNTGLGWEWWYCQDELQNVWTSMNNAWPPVGGTLWVSGIDAAADNFGVGHTCVQRPPIVRYR